MHVSERLELHELHRLAAGESRARVRLRLQAVILARQGYSAPEIAMMLSVSRRAVQDWVRWYNAGGIGALDDRPRSGRGTILPRDRQEQLRLRLDAGALPADGVCTLRASDVKRILEAEFGVLYTLKGVYKLLHRLNYSSLVPRPRHKLADAQAQDAFKKTSPRGSIRSAPHIRKSVSRSTSRTKLASVSRER
jgi:transposase